MDLKFDLPGKIRNTRLLSTHGLRPVFEAVANSIQSIEDAEEENGFIEIKIDRGKPHLLKPAMEALRQLPDLRILNKSLRYLTQQPFERHGEIADRLLTLIEDEALLFPYQVAVVLDTLRFLHPADAKSVASRVRDYAFRKKRFWYVRQKAGEVVSVFPYKEDFAQSLAEQLVQDDHPWVRRSGCALLVRSPVQYVRERVQRLVYHADQGVSRAALYWKRCIDELSFADQCLARLKNGKQTDRAFLFAVPTLYAIRCNREPVVAARLNRTMLPFAASKSEKVRWHAEKLIQQTAWAIQTTKQKTAG